MKDDRKDWDKEGKDWNKEGIDEEACLTMEEWEEKLGSDKKSKDERWEYSDWSHEHLRELYIVLEKDCEAGDEESCEQLAILEANKERFGKEKEHEREWHDEDFKEDDEMTEIRAMMVELEVACEDGDEESCEGLEELMASLEEEKEEEKEECGREKEESEDESEEESEDEETSDEE